MKYNIEIDHHNKIVHYQHSGKIKQNEIGEVWDQLLQLKEFTQQGYNLLSDYRLGVLDMHIKETYEIVETLKKLNPILTGKKQAILIDDQYSTAGAILFEDLINTETGFIVKIFSTHEAALIWLLK
jgi:hypothetical protein